MKRVLLLLAVLAVPAHAHQAPSPDANNRYVKVTLLPDRARVTFTLLYGERPGAAERKAMDRDGDGRISDAEKRSFGEAARTAFAPRVTVGGQRAEGWTLADVGLGTPAVAAGTFAVDLSLDAPYPDPGASEQILLVDDAAAVPLAGEVELRVSESPGVRVAEAHLATEGAGIELAYAFTGNARAAGERQVMVRFVVDTALRPRRTWPALLAAGAALLAALGAVWRWRRYRKV